MEVNLGRWIMPESLRASIGQKDVLWKESEVINGHMVIAGGSGAGKTHNLRKIIRHLVATGPSDLLVHVFDVHDDIRIPGASEIMFSESTDVGLNPLVVDPNHHTGGVRKAIRNFINTINKSGRKLGDRQEAVLGAVLEELYAANGFFANDPNSWSLHSEAYRKTPKKQPTITDLSRWSHFKYKQMFTGGDQKSAKALDILNREAAKFQRTAKESRPEDVEKNLAPLKDDAISAYTDYINSIKKGDELDALLKYDSTATFKSVLDRIENLKNCGVFRDKHPDFSEDANVWRYRIKNLGKEEKKLFVLFRLRELYYKAMARGEQDRICEVIVLDESSLFMDSDPDHIISIMANEIRKFGTALICASQSFTHFTDDFLASVATKIILGIDEMYWEKMARQLQIKKEWLQKIVLQRSALIQIKRRVGPEDPTSAVKWFFAALPQERH